MLTSSTLFHTTLDDRQVIKGKLSGLTRREVISLANQYRRVHLKSIADELMRYQHNQFSTNSPYKG